MGSLHLTRTRVDSQRKGLRNSPDYKYRLLLHFSLRILHWIRRDLVGKGSLESLSLKRKKCRPYISFISGELRTLGRYKIGKNYCYLGAVEGSRFGRDLRYNQPDLSKTGKLKKR
jgi:hypothetical protein